MSAGFIEADRVQTEMEIEITLLSGILSDEAGASVTRLVDFGEGHFWHPDHWAIFKACREMASEGVSLGEVYEISKRSGVSLPQIFQIAEADRSGIRTKASAESMRQTKLRGDLAALSRSIAAEGNPTAETFRGYARQFDDLAGRADGPRNGLPAVSPRLRAKIEARRFNFAKPPEEPLARFLIKGRPICTPGNLTNLIAQAKAGKSAFIAAMIAAAICAESGVSDRDTLGVTSKPPGKLKLIAIDTEQSPFDHDQLIRRSLRRSGSEALPTWLLSYGLAGFSAFELRQAINLIMHEAAADGGIFAVIIDGTADLVADVNDAQDCNAFVAELHGLAIAHRCPIINVVHENPGQDGGKMRGHLGSQLERKAESNLRLKKSDEVTVVFSEKMRRAPILENEGPRFSWDDTVTMHVSRASSGITKSEAKRGRLQDMVEATFAHLGKPFARYSELLNAIGETRKIGASAAEDRFTDMKKFKLIQKDALGNWSINPVTP